MTRSSAIRRACPGSGESLPGPVVDAIAMRMSNGSTLAGSRRDRRERPRVVQKPRRRPDARRRRRRLRRIFPVDRDRGGGDCELPSSRSAKELEAYRRLHRSLRPNVARGRLVVPSPWRSSAKDRGAEHHIVRLASFDSADAFKASRCPQHRRTQVRAGDDRAFSEQRDGVDAPPAARRMARVRAPAARWPGRPGWSDPGSPKRDRHSQQPLARVGWAVSTTSHSKPTKSVRICEKRSPFGADGR